MQCPQAMQPKGLSLQTWTFPLWAFSTSAGHILAHEPHSLQIPASILTLPDSR